MVVGSKASLLQRFGHARELFLASFCAAVLVCVWERMRGVLEFLYLCVWTCPPAYVLFCVCPHALRGHKYNPRMQTHTYAHARAGHKRVVMATHTDVNKRGSRVNIVSLLSGRVQFISMEPRKAAIYMKRELFLGNRGLSEGFDVSCLLLA